MSDYPAIPFPDELVHLEQVSARLSDALQQAEASVRRADREYADMTILSMMWLFRIFP